MTMIYLLAGLVVFAAIGVPLAYAIGMSCIGYLAIIAPQFIQMMPQRIWAGSFSYVMVAMPLFIFMGELMNESGITKRLIDFCMYIVRPIRGGLGEVNIVASMIFGGISGSSVADTSALGSVLIPEMEKRGYPKEFAAGVTVASSTMGMVIPPSIPMIMFSMISGASIGALFLAGLIPGILVGLSQLIMSYSISKKRGYHPKYEAFDFKHFIITMLYGMPAAIMPLVIVLSISFGIATPSESAGIAVLYALILGLLVYKKLTWKAILAALKRTLISSSSIVIIIGFSTIFTWIMTMQHVPMIVSDFFLGIAVPRWVLLLLLDILILVLGTFIDVSPAIIMLAPMLLPVMRGIGVSDLQFGAIFIVGLAIGLATPPVGMCLNTCNKICGLPVINIARGALPFIMCNILVLLLVTFIPGIATGIPALMGY